MFLFKKNFFFCVKYDRYMYYISKTSSSDSNSLYLCANSLELIKETYPFHLLSLYLHVPGRRADGDLREVQRACRRVQRRAALHDRGFPHWRRRSHGQRHEHADEQRRQSDQAGAKISRDIPNMGPARVRPCRRLTPATERKPSVAGTGPQSILKVVVLPAPFGPKVQRFPFMDFKGSIETAVKSPNLRTRFLTMIFTFRGLDSAS